LRDVLRRQTAPTLIEVSAGSYTMGGGFLASLVTDERQIAEYGSADRLNQVSLQAIVAVGNALNPWVAESEGAQFARRARLALGAHTALGAAGFLGLALLGPWASALLFGERLAAGAATCAAFGAYFFLVSLQTALARHILVSRGRVRVVLVATLCGAGIGVPSVILGAHLFGATGAASGLALGEGLICLVLAAPAAITVRRHRDRPTGPRGPGPVADPLGEVRPG
jgi:PST family polysaccharide transporter